MPDKTANWGVPGSGARYRTQDSDPTGGGNFVVAERLDSNGDPVDVLLEWEETAGEWRYGGPVNLDGGDVTNVGALDANSVSTEQLNNIKYLKSGDVLNDVVNNTTTPATFVLPDGTVYYDDAIQESNSVAIIGRGSKRSVIQANGTDERLDRIWDNQPDSQRHYSGFSVDMSGVPGKGRMVSVAFDSEIDLISMSDIEVINMDLSNLDGPNGIITVRSGGYVDRLYVSGCDFRQDTATNIQPEEYHTLRTDSDSAEGTVSVDSSTTVKGGLYRTIDPSARSRGFQARVDKKAKIDGYYEGCDNYCSQITLTGDNSIGIASGTSSNGGGGDQWEIRGPAGTAIFECDVLPVNGGGDRGIISKGSLDQIILRNPLVAGSHVGAEFRGFGTLKGSITLNNCGSVSTTKPALQINDSDSQVGKVSVSVMVLNDTTERDMDPAIEINDTDGSGFADGTLILEGSIEGYETDIVSDQTPTGTTLDTARLFDDGAF